MMRCIRRICIPFNSIDCYVEFFRVDATEVVLVRSEGLFEKLDIHHVDIVSVLDDSADDESWS